MDKQNYRESLEKDRQEISVNNDGLSRRAQRNTSNQKSNKKNLLLPSLFFIFILIPVAILIYVAVFYEPDDTLTSTANDNEVSFETNPSSQDTPLVPLEEEEEKEKEPAKEEPAEEEEAKEETSGEKENDSPAEEPKEEPKEEQPAEQTDTPVEEQPEEPVQAQKTVVVKDNETLYRIAVNNYGASGAAAAVEKIKQANGLTSNEIYVGQTLILP